MVAIDRLVQEANAALTDPSVQAQVRQMHADDVPLVDMVRQLGLDGDLTPEIIDLLDGLPAETVAGIRQSILDMLDNGGTVMPLDCGVATAELAAVTVQVVVRDAPTIVVRATG